MTNQISQISCQKIISGGQTGVDRGALDACIVNGFPCDGWCPKGRLAEDGRINNKYPLKETKSEIYEIRTKKNVLDSDGTLILYHKKLTGGTFLTLEFAEHEKKPVLLLNNAQKNQHEMMVEIFRWLKMYEISVLNVAGPRESEWHGGYEISFNLISSVLRKIKK